MFGMCLERATTSVTKAAGESMVSSGSRLSFVSGASFPPLAQSRVDSSSEACISMQRGSTEGSAFATACTRRRISLPCCAAISTMPTASRAFWHRRGDGVRGKDGHRNTWKDMVCAAVISVKCFACLTTAVLISSCHGPDVGVTSRSLWSSAQRSYCLLLRCTPKVVGLSADVAVHTSRGERYWPSSEWPPARSKRDHWKCYRSASTKVCSTASHKRAERNCNHGRNVCTYGQYL